MAVVGMHNLKKGMFKFRGTRSGCTLLKRRRKDIQHCSKMNFPESHPHWMQLWNVTVENARRKASSFSKVSPGWNPKPASRWVGIDGLVALPVMVVVESLCGSLLYIVPDTFNFLRGPGSFLFVKFLLPHSTAL